MDQFIEIPINARWVQDYLDQYNAAYVGPSASSLKKMLHKHQTYTTLTQHGVPSPQQFYIESVDELSTHSIEAAMAALSTTSISQLTTGLKTAQQFIVKPCYGSNSTGIDESSVVSTSAALQDKARYVLQELAQAVVIEEYLPGDEYTVLALGNGDERHFYLSLIHI